MSRLLLTSVLAFLGLWSSWAGDIRVMSWNLQDMDIFDGDGNGRVAWQAAAEDGIAETIRRVDPDVCFIAEAPSLIELEFFVERQGLDYRVIHLRQQSGRRDFADSLALLHKPPVRSAALETPPVPGSGRSDETAYLDWSYRGLLSADFGDFSVVGVHLKSPWDGKRRSYDIRDAQARGLLEFIDGIDGPLVVLGDFNDAPGRDGRESAFGIPDTLGLLGEALSRAPGSGNTQEDGLDVDHIFVRDAVAGPRRTEATDWELSDHRPVWADISY